jgi:hypothetical protein
MDGQYLDKSTINEIKKWYNSVIVSKTSWEANYLYLDEICKYENAARKDWINDAIHIYNILLNNIIIDENLLFFVRFVLKGKKIDDFSGIISYDWKRTG